MEFPWHSYISVFHHSIDSAYGYRFPGSNEPDPTTTIGSGGCFYFLSIIFDLLSGLTYFLEVYVRPVVLLPRSSRVKVLSARMPLGVC